MCGICGIFGNQDTATQASTITAMLATITHRGPDGSGLFSDSICSLGHRRLAIIDLSQNGQQPMCNEDSSIWTVTNGEIYNYKILREALRATGHTFRSATDTEIAIHLYETYGDAFVKLLRGMFAMALYDSKQKKLILARDASGKKPLYYTRYDGKLWFASEIKALLAGGIPCHPNYREIPTHLLYQYIPGEETLFSGVKKLPAGHTLVERYGEDPESPKRYWYIKDSRQYCADAVNKLREKLMESVELRLQSDVPVGAFLSGGIDSAAVVGLWRRQCNSSTIHTFTASFGKVTEAYWAKKTSSWLGTEYHEVPITSTMVADEINEITWHHDEPLGDAATINNYFLAKEAKKWVTVVLAGEGGDEIFGGYPWYRYAEAIALASKLPYWARENGKRVLGIIGGGNPVTPMGIIGRLAMGLCQPNRQATLAYPTTAMSQLNLEWLLKNDCLTYSYPDDCIGVDNHYNQMLATDYQNLLAEKFLMKADKATMAWGIEERLPLLDQEIVKLMLTVEPGLKVDKLALRQAIKAEKILPKEIIWRKKQGFGTPIVDWIHNPRLGVRETLLGGRLIGELCKEKAIRTLLGRLDTNYGKGEQHMALSYCNIVWGLFALQTWYNVWWH